MSKEPAKEEEEDGEVGGCLKVARLKWLRRRGGKAIFNDCMIVDECV